jgi:hypothetical protein
VFFLRVFFLHRRACGRAGLVVLVKHGCYGAGCCSHAPRADLLELLLELAPSDAGDHDGHPTIMRASWQSERGEQHSVWARG